MTLYGDLDVSIMDERPAGRKPIITRLYSEKRRDEMYQFLREQLREGRQAYVVYPLVEESEKLDLKDAETGFEKLREAFRPYTVDLIHGRMFSYEKEEAMDRFKRGETDMLVATTVIEVGVDVANATMMVVEHAERFGLSQLHQLRGRVGRGPHPSVCILVADPGEQSQERLAVFRETTDGFRIAQADLQIRGQGDLFGAQQHGRDPLLRFADLGRDEGLLTRARRIAREIVARDPDLRDGAQAKIRELLERRHAERLRMWRVG
jgi:ATP-dependent DNA helicase RecG